MKIPDFMVEAVKRFNGKLLRALHFKHTGLIVPSTAWTRTQWWTNANFLAGQFPQEIASLMPGRAVLQRGNVSLGDQFSYAYGTGDRGTLGAYLATFRKSFAVLGIVVFNAALMSDVDEAAMQKAMDASAKDAGNKANIAEAQPQTEKTPAI